MSASKPVALMDPDTKSKKSAGAPKRSLWFAGEDCFAVLSLAILTALYFFKTLFFGATISRLCVLAEWDSVFDAWRTGHAQAYDPSLVQIFLPDYVFLAQNLSKGILPLWNSHCGLGYPFIADIQSSVFAPIRMIYNFFPTVQTYNYYLIGELFTCLLGSYFLGKALGLRRLPAILAAIVYSFCPYNMWYMEMNLGASSCLFPLTALSFVQAAERRNLGSALISGICAGLLILSGHPECSFFGIVQSSAFLFLLIVCSSAGSVFSQLLSSAKILLIAAISTVAISAPALFPFAEYLLNGESYKYGSTYSTPVSWNGIFFNLCNPGQGGASPYLGIIALFLIPLSVLALQRHNRERHKTLALLIMTVLTFLLVSQLGPVQILFSKPPFTAIITRYALPYLLMLLAVLAATGLDQLAGLFDSGRKNLSKFETYICIFALTVLPVLAFTFCKIVSGDVDFMKIADFDAMLPRTALSSSAWKRDLFCTLAFSSITLGSLFVYRERFTGRNGKVFGYIVLAAALICSFVSQASIGKLSLPQQSKFFYPETELIKKLKDDQYRTISTCEYVFRPATNAVYGVNFLTYHNPLFPKRFLEFLKACGASTDTFNQSFNSKNLSLLLDLASVKYILSLDPIIDSDNPDRFRLYFESQNRIKVYENTQAAPRAYLVYGPEILKALADSNNTSIKYFLPATDAPGEFEKVDKFEAENSNIVKIDCNCLQPALLILTDIYYPGWNAYVDGQKTEIQRANFVFRGIKLQAGKHQVVFKYEPNSFTIGASLFAVFALIAAWILGSRAKNYRL